MRIWKNERRKREKPVDKRSEPSRTRRKKRGEKTVPERPESVFFGFLFYILRIPLAYVFTKEVIKVLSLLPLPGLRNSRHRSNEKEEGKKKKRIAGATPQKCHNDYLPKILEKIIPRWP